ncbi:OSCP, subunit 5 of the stator stalk of mitochondrial F1F0 ATP synthase [Lactarius deliciosus]|nr:OSCP, subunit 5 of the stator stalk of mitochondrial F1F0 ATP synthase [Lactarius deliciosus]
MSFSLLRTCAPTAGFGRRAASGIALKYATATFSAALAKSPQVLTKVQTELNAISKSIGDTPELKTFVTNPTLSVKDRNVGLSGLYARAEGTGAKKEPVSDITRNLFIILSENGRLGETTGVIEGFNELVAKHKGELNVTVTSAVPLTKDVLTRLEATLKQSQTAQQAKSLKLTNKVNPSVLGGLVVDFGEKTIDLSVSSRINKLNSLLQRGCQVSLFYALF